MKNQQGIVWAPVLIMIGAVVATGIVYLLWRFDHYSITDYNVTVVNQANNNANTATSYTNRVTERSQLCDRPWNNDTATLICDRLDVGWHYVATTDRCVYFNGSGCSTSPFTTGEECGRACVTSKIDPGNPLIR